MIDENMEKKLLDAVQKGDDVEKCLMKENSWPILYHLSNIRENILEWYDFDPQASLLEIGAECGALTGLFCRNVDHVVAIEVSERDAAVNLERNKKYDNLTVKVGDFFNIEIEEKFDYVTLIGVLGCSGCCANNEKAYMDMLKKAKECLKPDGRLFLAIENKYGLKYFAGATEDHTGRCFDGLENYVSTEGIRTFSHNTLHKVLLEAGFLRNEFYYPMPDYKLPSEIYSDGCLPSFGSIRYASVAYDRDRYELFDERLAFDSICQDGMFGEFANSFLVISDGGQQGGTEGRVPAGEKRSALGEEYTPKNVLYAKYNRQRAPEFQISTKIITGEDGSRYVEKEALRPEARAHVEGLSENRKKLTGLNFMSDAAEASKSFPVPVEIKGNENGRAVFPYVEGVSLAKEVNTCLDCREAFLLAIHKAVDSIYGTFLESEDKLVDFEFTKEFEDIFGKFDDIQDAEIVKEMKSLRISNIDSILSNFVRMPDGKLVCLDYEWVFDFPIPVEYLIYRTVFYYYSENIHYIKMSEPELWASFELTEKKISFFRRMDDHFQQYVHGKNRKYIYTANYGKKTINIGKDIQNGESWFLSIADDIHYLNSHLGGYRRDLIKCRVKVHRKNAFLDKCQRKLINILKSCMKNKKY